MIKIADIKELKLNITWRMLYRGLLEKQIPISEIVEYAMEQLEKGDDRIEICELAGSGDNDLEDIMNILYDLADEEKSQDDLEYRKLRATRVNNFLKDKNTNCIFFKTKLRQDFLGLPVSSRRLQLQSCCHLVPWLSDAVSKDQEQTECG